MKKKSHISLARYLMNNMHVKDLSEHKKAFYIGSILPDLSPSFLTKRHTIEETFDTLIGEIKKVTVDYDINKGIGSYYARHLGVITHYLSDYCTFPHNASFAGTLTEHLNYEKELKLSLRDYVESEVSKRERTDYKRSLTTEDFIRLIQKIHKEYLKAVCGIKADIQYIIELCYRVVDAILAFLELALEKLGSRLNFDGKVNHDTLGLMNN